MYVIALHMCRDMQVCRDFVLIGHFYRDGNFIIKAGNCFPSSILRGSLGKRVQVVRQPKAICPWNESGSIADA